MQNGWPAGVEQHPPPLVRLRVGQPGAEGEGLLHRLVETVTGRQVEVHDRRAGHAGGR